MNLSTDPILTPVRVKFLEIDEHGRPWPVMYEFRLGVNNAGLKDKAVEVIRRLSGVPYVMCEYSSTDVSPFENNLRSGVNLVGSFKESFLRDIKFSIWKELTAIDPSAEVVLECAKIEPGQGSFMVAYDGEIFCLTPNLIPGPNHRDSCDSCQMGKNLIAHSIDEIRFSVCYNIDNIKDGKIYFGENPIKNSYSLKSVSANRIEGGDKISEFIQWFIEVNEGPLTMADLTISFSVGV